MSNGFKKTNVTSILAARRSMYDSDVRIHRCTNHVCV